MADVLGRGVGGDVVHHGDCAGRGPVVAVRVLEAGSTCEAEAGGKS